MMHRRLLFTLDHLALSVEDVDNSVEFYQRVFGLREILNPNQASATRWLVFEGGRELHLIPRPGAQIMTTQAVHFALVTTDIHAFVTHLQEQGVVYYDWHGSQGRIHERADGVLQVYFKDPDDYWVEVNNAHRPH